MAVNSIAKKQYSLMVDISVSFPLPSSYTHTHTHTLFTSYFYKRYKPTEKQVVFH